MRFGTFGNLTPPPVEYDPQWTAGLIANLQRLLQGLERVIDGNLGFGDGTDFDNVVGKWMTYTSDETPGTETELEHDLGAIPIGFILMVPPESGVVNKGSTPWTTSSLFLTCTEASQTAVIFVLIASQGLHT